MIISTAQLKFYKLNSLMLCVRFQWEYFQGSAPDWIHRALFTKLMAIPGQDIIFLMFNMNSTNLRASAVSLSNLGSLYSLNKNFNEYSNKINIRLINSTNKLVLIKFHLEANIFFIKNILIYCFFIPFQ